MIGALTAPASSAAVSDHWASLSDTFRSVAISGISGAPSERDHRDDQGHQEQDGRQHGLAAGGARRGRDGGAHARSSAWSDSIELLQQVGGGGQRADLGVVALGEVVAQERAVLLAERLDERAARVGDR